MVKHHQLSYYLILAVIAFLFNKNSFFSKLKKIANTSTFYQICYWIFSIEQSIKVMEAHCRAHLKDGKEGWMSCSLPSWEMELKMAKIFFDCTGSSSFQGDNKWKQNLADGSSIMKKVPVSIWMSILSCLTDMIIPSKHMRFAFLKVFFLPITVVILKIFPSRLSSWTVAHNSLSQAYTLKEVSLKPSIHVMFEFLCTTRAAECTFLGIRSCSVPAKLIELNHPCDHVTTNLACKSLPVNSSKTGNRSQRDCFNVNGGWNTVIRMTGVFDSQMIPCSL